MPPDWPPPLVEVETPTAALWVLDELDASSRAALKFTDPALWIDPSPSAEMFVPSKLASPLVVLMLRLPPDEKPPTTAWLEDDCSSSWPSPPDSSAFTAFVTLTPTLTPTVPVWGMLLELSGRTKERKVGKEWG